MHEDTTAAPGQLELVDAFVLLSELVQRVFIESAEQRELSVQQARLLGILRGRKPTMAQLARLLELDKASTSGLVHRAQKRGLVDRLPVPEDGRSYRVELTPAGSHLANSFAANVSAQLGALTTRFGPADSDRLTRLISEVVNLDAELRNVDLSPEVERAIGSDPLEPRGLGDRASESAGDS